MFYLGNFRLDNHIQSDVEEAARKIKRDIRFLDTPIPPVEGKVIDEKYIAGLGCIAVFDDKKDCSKFWVEFNTIKNLRENENSA